MGAGNGSKGINAFCVILTIYLVSWWLLFSPSLASHVFRGLLSRCQNRAISANIFTVDAIYNVFYLFCFGLFVNSDPDWMLLIIRNWVKSSQPHYVLCLTVTQQYRQFSHGSSQLSLVHYLHNQSFAAAWKDFLPLLLWFCLVCHCYRVVNYSKHLKGI